MCVCVLARMLVCLIDLHVAHVDLWRWVFISISMSVFRCWCCVLKCCLRPCIPLPYGACGLYGLSVCVCVCVMVSARARVEKQSIMCRGLTTVGLCRALTAPTKLVFSPLLLGKHCLDVVQCGLIIMTVYYNHRKVSHTHQSAHTHTPTNTPVKIEQKWSVFVRNEEWPHPQCERNKREHKQHNTTIIARQTLTAQSFCSTLIPTPVCAHGRRGIHAAPSSGRNDDGCIVVVCLLLGVARQLADSLCVALLLQAAACALRIAWFMIASQFALPKARLIPTHTHIYIYLQGLDPLF